MIKHLYLNPIANILMRNQLSFSLRSVTWKECQSLLLFTLVLELLSNAIQHVKSLKNWQRRRKFLKF